MSLCPARPRCTRLSEDCSICSIDPVTIEPCDYCKIKLPDYARKASETTTLTGHAKCMRYIDTGESLE